MLRQIAVGSIAVLLSVVELVVSIVVSALCCRAVCCCRRQTQVNKYSVLMTRICVSNRLGRTGGELAIRTELEL